MENDKLKRIQAKDELRIKVYQLLFNFKSENNIKLSNKDILNVLSQIITKKTE